MTASQAPGRTPPSPATGPLRAGVVLATVLLVMTVLTSCAHSAPSAVSPSAPGSATGAPTPAEGTPPGQRKVVFDTDFGQLNDDSEALFVLLQAGVDVLGVTTVSGNTWSAEGAAYALRQLQLEHKQSIPVLQGANEPLLGGRAARLPAEAALFGVKTTYAGAWGHPQPPSYRQLAQPPYGGYATTSTADGNAVDFIVDAIKRNPHQVTLFVLGPATNVALAVKKNPEIVPLVKQVIYMGGAFDVPGNQGPAAEFNVWFDPEAARIAFTTPFADQLAIPLDLTNTVWFGKPEFDRIVAGPATSITTEFKDLMGPKFAADPSYRTHLWDALTAAVFLDPSLVTASSVRKVAVDTTEGLDYGRTLGFPPDRAPMDTQQVRIVQGIDVPRFFDLFVQQLTKA